MLVNKSLLVHLYITEGNEMNRSYKVICHMAMSIDGRAAGHYLAAPNSVSLFEFGNSPDQRIRKFKLDKFERIDPDGIRLIYLSEGNEAHE